MFIFSSEYHSKSYILNDAIKRIETFGILLFNIFSTKKMQYRFDHVTRMQKKKRNISINCKLNSLSDKMHIK